MAGCTLNIMPLRSRSCSPTFYYQASGVSESCTCTEDKNVGVACTVVDGPHVHSRIIILERGRMGSNKSTSTIKHTRWSALRLSMCSWNTEQSRICMIEMPLSILLEFETRPAVWVFISVCMYAYYCRIPVAFIGKGRVALLIQL